MDSKKVSTDYVVRTYSRLGWQHARIPLISALSLGTILVFGFRRRLDVDDSRGTTAAILQRDCPINRASFRRNLELIQ